MGRDRGNKQLKVTIDDATRVLLNHIADEWAATYRDRCIAWVCRAFGGNDFQDMATEAVQGATSYVYQAYGAGKYPINDNRFGHRVLQKAQYLMLDVAKSNHAKDISGPDADTAVENSAQTEDLYADIAHTAALSDAMSCLTTEERQDTELYILHQNVAEVARITKKDYFQVDRTLKRARRKMQRHMPGIVEEYSGLWSKKNDRRQHVFPECRP